MKEGSGGEAGASYESEASPFQRPARRPLLQRLVPLTEHVRGYRGGTLRRDLLAGVTVAALALPASLGVVLAWMNPEHMDLLFKEKMGQMMIMAAIVMQTVGYFWIRQVIKIEV